MKPEKFAEHGNNSATILMTGIFLSIGLVKVLFKSFTYDDVDHKIDELNEGMKTIRQNFIARELTVRQLQQKISETDTLFLKVYNSKEFKPTFVQYKKLDKIYNELNSYSKKFMSDLK